MSETHVIDGEEFEGEEEEEVEETPVAAAVVDGEEEEEEEEQEKAAAKEQPAAAPKEAGAQTESASAAQVAASETQQGAGEAAAAATTATAAAEKTPGRQSALEQERVARFREQRDRLFADVGRQWSSVYTHVNRELAAASGTGLAGALSVTQDAAKALRSARTDIEKLVAVL